MLEICCKVNWTLSHLCILFIETSYSFLFCLFFICSAYLVPVFSFGENELFKQVSNPEGSLLRTVQDKLQKIMGFALPLFHARGIFQYSFGLVPYRKPIHTVGMYIEDWRLLKQVKALSYFEHCLLLLTEVLIQGK